jgi:hypothetical protein
MAALAAAAAALAAMNESSDAVDAYVGSTRPLCSFQSGGE